MKIFKNFKYYILQVCILIILVFAQVLCDLYLPTLMSSIINKGIINEDIPYILNSGKIMVMVSGFGLVCAVIASFIGARISMGIGGILRSRFFERVEEFSLKEFDQFGASTLLTRTTNDIIQIQVTTILIINMMLRAPLTVIGGIFLAYQLDKGLTLIFAVALPALVALVAIIMGIAMPVFKRVQLKLDRINLILSENLNGIRVIRAFNRDEHEKKRFEKVNDDLTNTYMKAYHIMAFLLPGFMLAINCIIICILWFGSIRINSGKINIGVLTAFLQYAVLIFSNFAMFSIIFVFLPRAQAAAERITQVLETKYEIIDPVPAKKMNDIKGFVEFKNVTFRYSGAEQTAVSGISFISRPGETTAIIGGTGSGKSTLVKLIPRFYDVSEGEVLVDGINVKYMKQSDLREKIGYVPQKAILFNGTIMENLCYGKADATFPEISKAAETAQALEFISDMQEGFHTVLSEGGNNLSGGQKQRLSIARALVRQPEIYIFDDSFSALDFKTDAKLRAALKMNLQKSTVIIVAQRVATVMKADRVIVLDKGNMVGMGTHQELLESCDIYRDIVNSQFLKGEIA